MRTRMAVVTQDTEDLEPEYRDPLTSEEFLDLDNDIRFSVPSAEDVALELMEQKEELQRMLSRQADETAPKDRHARG